MRGRMLFKAAAMLVTLASCSLLVYEGGVALNFQEPRAVVDVVPDEPVTKTSVESETYKNITLDDIFISVKTTKHYQYSRVPVILKTWFQLAKNQTWFFTDNDNPHYQRMTDGHMVNTNCSDSHQRSHLCCKTSVEYDHFIASGKKWFCHFDDDNYVNIPRLVEVLRRYNHKRDWYLGRTSIYEPVKLKQRKMKGTFWFATGGAGYCLSESLAYKMTPVASDGKFISICEKIRFPDDVSMGFIVEKLMQGNLTLVPEFHSHLEPMKLLPPEKFKDQISFGYSTNKDNEWNVINVPGFDTAYDPTRFLSLHCFLFPDSKFCPR